MFGVPYLSWVLRRHSSSVLCLSCPGCPVPSRQGLPVPAKKQITVEGNVHSGEIHPSLARNRASSHKQSPPTPSLTARAAHCIRQTRAHCPSRFPSRYWARSSLPTLGSVLLSQSRSIQGTQGNPPGDPPPESAHPAIPTQQRQNLPSLPRFAPARPGPSASQACQV